MKNFFSIILFFSLFQLSSCHDKKETPQTETKNNIVTKNPQVLIKTSKGDITIELFQDKSPISVKNFLEYTQNKKYDGTIFHRVIKNFMIQGGGLKPSFEKVQTFAPIKNEAQNGLKNLRGTLAMARTGIVDSATNQFFINVVDNNFLDHRSINPSEFGYAVFGKVLTGMDVVDQIKLTPTSSQFGHADVPVEAITILSVQKINN